MATIRCPHCGSPVMVRGNRWECGWCGDFGDISSLNRSERIKLSRASDAALEDLERGVLSILEGIQAHFGSGEKERLLACKLAIYGMSHALVPANNQTQHNLQLLQVFFQRYSFCTAGEVLGAARSGNDSPVDFLLCSEIIRKCQFIRVFHNRSLLSGRRSLVHGSHIFIRQVDVVEIKGFLL